MSIHLTRARAALVKQAGKRFFVGTPEQVAGKLLKKVPPEIPLTPLQRRRLEGNALRLAQRSCQIRNFLSEQGIDLRAHEVPPEKMDAFKQAVFKPNKASIPVTIYISPLHLHLVAKQNHWARIGLSTTQFVGQHVRKPNGMFKTRLSQKLDYGTFTIGVTPARSQDPALDFLSGIKTEYHERFHVIEGLLQLTRRDAGGTVANVAQHDIRQEIPPRIYARQNPSRYLSVSRSLWTPASSLGRSTRTLDMMARLAQLNAPPGVMENSLASIRKITADSVRNRKARLQMEEKLARARHALLTDQKAFGSQAEQLIGTAQQLWARAQKPNERLTRRIQRQTDQLIRVTDQILELGLLTPMEAAIHLAAYPVSRSRRDFEKLLEQGKT